MAKRKTFHIALINFFILLVIIVLIALIFRNRFEDQFPEEFVGEERVFEFRQKRVPAFFTNIVRRGIDEASSRLSRDIPIHFLTPNTDAQSKHEKPARIAILVDFLKKMFRGAEETSVAQEVRNPIGSIIEQNITGNADILLNGEDPLQQYALLSNEIIIDSSEDHQVLGYSGQQKIVEDGGGVMYLAYRKKFGDEYQIYVARAALGPDSALGIETLVEPLSFALRNITQRVPSITVDSANRAHIVWYGGIDEDEPANRQIHYTGVTDQKNVWKASSIVSPVKGFSDETEYWQEHPDILVGANDWMYVVWEGKDEQYDRQQIKFSRSVNGGVSWSSWKNIDPSDDFTYSRPTIVQGTSGRLHAVAYSAQGVFNDTQQVQYSYSDDLGDTWSEWRVISGGEYDARHVSVVSHGDSVHVAYRAERQAGEDSTGIFYVSGNGEVWQAPILASPAESGRYHFFPSIGLVEDEMICIVWTETESASMFPQDDPISGDIYLGCKDQEIFEEPIRLTSGGMNIYGNIPNRIHSALRIPVVYYENRDGTIRLRFVAIS